MECATQKLSEQFSFLNDKETIDPIHQYEQMQKQKDFESMQQILL